MSADAMFISTSVMTPTSKSKKSGIPVPTPKLSSAKSKNNQKTRNKIVKKPSKGKRRSINFNDIEIERKTPSVRGILKRVGKIDKIPPFEAKSVLKPERVLIKNVHGTQPVIETPNKPERVLLKSTPLEKRYNNRVKYVNFNTPQPRKMHAKSFKNAVTEKTTRISSIKFNYDDDDDDGSSPLLKNSIATSKIGSNYVTPKKISWFDDIKSEIRTPLSNITNSPNTISPTKSDSRKSLLASDLNESVVELAKVNLDLSPSKSKVSDLLKRCVEKEENLKLLRQKLENRLSSIENRSVLSELSIYDEISYDEVSDTEEFLGETTPKVADNNTTIVPIPYVPDKSIYLEKYFADCLKLNADNDDDNNKENIDPNCLRKASF